MIRWSYLVPRALIVGLIWSGLYFGVEPALRTTASTVGEQAIGGKVEIGDVRLSYLRPAICLKDIAVANPRSPTRNLFEAQEISLQLDWRALLQKKWVVKEGRIRGLKWNAPRSESGEIERWSPSVNWQQFSPQLPQVQKEWFQKAFTLMNGQLEERLQSVQLVQEMVRRWPAEYRKMERRIQDLRRRLEDLQKVLQTASDNPLRHLDQVEPSLRELEAVRRQLEQLPKQLEHLRRQAERDKENLARARQRDLQWIEQVMRLDSLRPDALSQYLLGREMSQRVQQALAWIKWTKNHLPTPRKYAEPTRSRGEEIRFASAAPTPNWLIERFLIEGETTLRGQPLYYSGLLKNFTDQPALWGRPTVLSLKTQGAAEFHLQATFDRTGDLPQNQIVINFPALSQPEITLGDKKKLALVVSPGNTHLWLSLDMQPTKKETRIQGRLLVKQTPVDLTPHIALGNGQRLQTNLRRSLEKVRQLQVQVTIDGSLESPRWRIESDLGDRLAAAVEETAARELEFHRTRLLAKMDQLLNQQVSRIDQLAPEWFGRKQHQLLERLRIDRNQADWLKQQIAGRFELPKDLRSAGEINKSLDRLFRR